MAFLKIVVDGFEWRSGDNRIGVSVVIVVVAVVYSGWEIDVCCIVRN